MSVVVPSENACLAFAWTPVNLTVDRWKVWSLKLAHEGTACDMLLNEGTQWCVPFHCSFLVIIFNRTWQFSVHVYFFFFTLDLYIGVCVLGDKGSLWLSAGGSAVLTSSRAALRITLTQLAWRPAQTLLKISRRYRGNDPSAALLVNAHTHTSSDCVTLTDPCILSTEKKTKWSRRLWQLGCRLGL